MWSARGWARLAVAAFAVALLGTAACEEEDAAFGPLDDTTPPTVSITSVSSTGDTLSTSIRAEDFIGVKSVITELRRTDQFETVITAGGDTIVLGRLIGFDQTNFSGQKTLVDVDIDFLTGFTQPTVIQIRAIARDHQDNEAVDSTLVIVSGGGTTGLGGPQVSITSPLPGQTVRDNTLIRVGVQASDPLGLTQLNVELSGAVSAGDTTVFADFRTNVDTLLDFFIPVGALGPLTISAEAINTNTISGFASITVNVAAEVPDDTIPPIVSMIVSGGVQRRQDEPLRMEADDSLFIDIVALDQETAITRVGYTVVASNVKPGGTATETFFRDSVFATAVSGTVPITFFLTPLDLAAAVFNESRLPDTLFFQFTAWAFDSADPVVPNCGATVDIEGSAFSLPCNTSDPVTAVGVEGGFTERLVVSGRTIGFPQGAIIADAAVDTIRELLLLSDFEFGIVRAFDLRNEAFVGNIPVGSEPWGVFLDNSEDGLLVANSGGTNISLVTLGSRVVGPQPGTWREVDRFQTQDLKVYKVVRAFDNVGNRIFPVTFFDYSDRPQFIAQAAGGEILFSTRPAEENQQPGTIREYDPVQREIRFFISYAGRAPVTEPQIQIVNADSVSGINGGTAFKVCDHTRGDPSPAARSCVVADSLNGAIIEVGNANTTLGWDVIVLSDLDIPSIGLQDTTFLAASGDREFIAIGEGDTGENPGRIIVYRSATRTITDSRMVSDLTENATQTVSGLALNNDGTLGVGRGQVAFYFGPDQPGGPNVLRLLGTNDNISPTGTGAGLHPNHDQFSFDIDSERLSFLGSGDARIEMVDTRYFEFSRGEVVIRDPIVGPLRVTRPLPTDATQVRFRLYGVTENGVVVVPVRGSDIIPVPVP